MENGVRIEEYWVTVYRYYRVTGPGGETDTFHDLFDARAWAKAEYGYEG